MKGLINRIFIGNVLLKKKIAIAVVLILLIVVPAASVQGVSTTLIVNADSFVGFTSLTSSLNPSVYGDTVTFTAVVSTSGGAPTGKVIFFELVMEGYSLTPIILGEDTTATSLGGDSYEYTFLTSTLAIGDHAIFAGYDNGSGGDISTGVNPIYQMVTDRIWPSVTITSAPPEITYSTQATFEFSSDTAGAEFECSLSESYDFTPDTWTWSPCNSPKVYTDLSLGSAHWFGVKAQGAPLTESTMEVHQWTIGVPQISITGGPAQYIESTEATLTFSSVPEGVDLVCSLLEYEYSTQNTVLLEEWVPCTSPRTYTGLSRGNAYYFGVKPAGATDDYAVSRQWMINRLTLTSSPNSSQFGSEVTFTATLWDENGTTPGGTVNFMEMVYLGFGAWGPELLGLGSGPTASGTGSYAFTFSTSALAVGFHNIFAMYTDEGGTITSLTITQEVTEVTAQAPVITTQPANHTTCAGSSVSFTAAASGIPAPTIQWQVSNDGGTTWNNISGATSMTYTFTAASGDNGKRYHAVFTNSAGSATTSAAILTVNTAPVVTTQPSNQTVTYGVPSATFSAAASGTAPSVQWRRSTNGTTWDLVPGATTSNLTIANPTVLMSGNQFRAEFSNACGTAISSAATLTVNKAALTVTASSPTDGIYGDPAPGITPSYAGFVLGDDGGDLDKAPTCSTTYVQGSGPGDYPTSCSGGVDANYAFSYVAGNFHVDKASLTITADNQTAQYSDASPSPLTFQYAGFVLGEDVSVINTKPTCSTTRLTVSPAGDYPITCSGGEDNNYTFSYVEGTFTVTRENAIITFDDGNPAALQVSAPEGPLNANELTLVLKVREKLPDMPAESAIAGDINNAGLIVKLEPLSGGGAITLDCTAAVEGTGYDGVKTFTCTNSQAIAVDTYDVVALIYGDYYFGESFDGFTVFDPSLGYATGGGWFYWPGTTEKTNFGFTMKYNKKATNIQGNLLVIRHHADGTISRLKSNALDGLALKDINGCGIATFSGKSTYETWDPEANEGLGGYVTLGGIPFSVYVGDCNEPGTGVDKFWVRGMDRLALEKPAPTNAVTIGGGNIVVPHTPNYSNEEPEEPIVPKKHK
ncbi:MAG: MBG domain-containing protein [Brevefilum sp.]|nr:MBG domain-containing protein [Brevefilum sp.]